MQMIQIGEGRVCNIKIIQLTKTTRNQQAGSFEMGRMCQ